MKAFFTCISIAIWVSWLNQGFSQCGTPFKVLHYTETSGYDHRTRNESLSMFQNLGTSNNFSVVNDNTGATFNSLTDLQAYQVIIFSNTSGNTILTAAQRANFEAYMESGGGFVGLHAASDTYRHSSADGTPKGGWDWFAEMLGASVQYTPTPHTANNHLGEMDHVLPCHATKHLPDPWSKREEYYYWQRGFYDFGKNNVLLQVRRTGGQTYDADRPISWFKHLPGGGRAFYTALGHNKSDYTTPGNEFSKHVLAGLLWTADPTPIEVSEFNGVDVPGVWVRQPGKLYSAGNNTFPYTVSNDKLYMANYRGGANNQHLVRQGALLDPTQQYVMSCKFKIIPSGGNVNSFCLNFQVKGDDNYTGNVNCWSINLDINGGNTGGVMKHMGFKGGDGSFAQIGQQNAGWARNNRNYFLRIEVNTRLDGSYDPKWITATIVDLATNSQKARFEVDYSRFPYQPDYSGNSMVRVGANTHGTAWDMWDLKVYYLNDDICGGAGPKCGFTLATPTITPESCTRNDGAIGISVAGGTGPFTYSWQNGATTASLQNLASGSYNVWVTDAAGCTDSFSVSVPAPDFPNASTATITDESCEGGDASIDVTISGGTSPYLTNWSTGQISEDISGIKAGKYFLTLQDAAGCQHTDSFVVELQNDGVVLQEFDSIRANGTWTIMSGANTNVSYTPVVNPYYVQIPGLGYDDHHLVREGALIDPNRPFDLELEFYYDRPNDNAAGIHLMVPENGNAISSWLVNITKRTGEVRFISFDPASVRASYTINGADYPLATQKWHSYKVSVHRRKNGNFSPGWVSIRIYDPQEKLIANYEHNFSTAPYQPNYNEKVRIGLNAYNTSVYFRKLKVYYTDSGSCNFPTANDTLAAYNYPFTLGVNIKEYASWTFDQLTKIATGTPQSDFGAPNVKMTLFEKELVQNGYSSKLAPLKHLFNQGITGHTAVIGMPTASHQDMTVYCGGPSDQVFDNLYEPIWDGGADGNPINENNYFAAYVYQTVSLYKDYIRIWEIGNEVDADNFLYGQISRGQPGNWWDQDPAPCHLTNWKAPIESYIRMLRIAHEVIHYLDEDAWVTTGSIKYPSFLDALLRNTDNPSGGTVDAVSYPLLGGAYLDMIQVHVVPQIFPSVANGSTFNRHSDQMGETIEELADSMRHILRSYGYDGGNYPEKNLGISLINIPRRAFPGFYGGEDVQRNFLMKTFVIAQKSNFTNLIVRNIGEEESPNSATISGELMGIYQNLNASPPGNEQFTQAGTGLNTYLRYLQGYAYDSAATSACQFPAGISGAAFQHPGGNMAYVIWAKTLVDQSEMASANYTFPPSIYVLNLTKTSWDNQSLSVVNSNFSLNGTPFMLVPTQQTFPVEWLTVEAISVPELRQTHIRWVTASEQDNHHFEVERSVDKAAFSVLGSVPAIGNSSTPTTYEFDDNAFFEGKIYYRIKQVDQNGQNSYSQVVSVVHDLTSTPSYQLLVYPNPVKDGLLNLEIRASEMVRATFEIRNLVGQEVRNWQAEYTGGRYVEEIELNGMPPGHYTFSSEVSYQNNSRTRLHYRFIISP